VNKLLLSNILNQQERVPDRKKYGKEKYLGKVISGISTTIEEDFKDFKFLSISFFFFTHLTSERSRKEGVIYLIKSQKYHQL
jgi:hypothetical protein